MNFIHKDAILPATKEFNLRLEAAAAILEKKILELDIRSLPVSDYSQRYFTDYLRKLRYSLQSCNLIISWAVAKSGKEPEQITFVDNGGGVGILSFLAKQAGIKTVIYNDIYDVATKDAAVIANALEVSVDHFCVGDADQLVSFVKENELRVDIVASRNVIEHIYNLDVYFETVKNISDGPLVLFFATTANQKNPLVDIYTKRLHRTAEYKGKKAQWGQKQRDAILPYLLIRKNILKDEFPGLSDPELAKLAALTRGMMKEDIILAGKKFLETKQLPKQPAHPTNTCDPFTGNWMEHLVPIDEYQRLFRNNGFEFELINGFYNTGYKMKVLNLITPVINKFIKFLGRRAIFLSPFIGLMGTRK